MFEKLQKSVGDALEFPPDVAGDGPKITITGRQQVLVENYISILSFTNEEICLETLEGQLWLMGKNFVLKTILPSELHIEGELVSLSFAGGAKNV